jgi:hypothetical protein
MKGEDTMTRLIAAPVSPSGDFSGNQVALSPHGEMCAGQPQHAAAAGPNNDIAWRRFLIALLRSLSAFAV